MVVKKPKPKTFYKKSTSTKLNKYETYSAKQRKIALEKLKKLEKKHGKIASNEIRRAKREQRQKDIKNNPERYIFEYALKRFDKISKAEFNRLLEKFNFKTFDSLSASEIVKIAKNAKVHHKNPNDLGKILSVFSGKNLSAISMGMKGAGHSFSEISDFLHTNFKATNNVIKALVESKISLKDNVYALKKYNRLNENSIKSIIKNYKLKTPEHLSGLLKNMHLLEINADVFMHDILASFNSNKLFTSKQFGKALVLSKAYNEMAIKNLLKKHYALDSVVISALKEVGIVKDVHDITRLYKDYYEDVKNISSKGNRNGIFEHFDSRFSGLKKKLLVKKEKRFKMLLDALVKNGFDKPEHIAKLMTYDLGFVASKVHGDSVIRDLVYGLTYTNKFDVNTQPRKSAQNFARALKAVGINSYNELYGSFEAYKKRNALVFSVSKLSNKTFLNFLLKEYGITAGLEKRISDISKLEW